MDDLETKLLAREKGQDKYHGKTVMRTPTYFCNDDNPSYERSGCNFITEFEEMILDQKPNILNKCLKSHVHMNDDLLFTYGEELLNELAVNIKKTKSTYGTLSTIYSLPVTAEIECEYEMDRSKTKYENSFTFKGKMYNSDVIYSFKKGTSTLKEVCPLYLELPSNLPLNLEKIDSHASNKTNNFDLNHKNNYLCYSKHNPSYEYDIELIKTLDNDNSSFHPYHVIKKNVEPIYVRLNQKGSTTITHIGILGCKAPVMTYKKKREKTTSTHKRTKRQKNKLLNNSINIFDNSAPISYVKKFELWYKGSITKKWNFLKHVTLGLNGVTACYSEELVSISDNFNSLEGIQTTEFKIVPVEYVNSPNIRIAVYGKVSVISKTKTKEGDVCEVVDYTVTIPDNSNKMLKRGSHWRYDYMYCGKPKNTLKADIIKEEMYQTKQLSRDDTD